MSFLTNDTLVKRDSFDVFINTTEENNFLPISSLFFGSVWIEQISISLIRDLPVVSR